MDDGICLYSLLGMGHGLQINPLLGMQPDRGRVGGQNLDIEMPQPTAYTLSPSLTPRTVRSTRMHVCAKFFCQKM